MSISFGMSVCLSVCLLVGQCVCVATQAELQLEIERMNE